MQLIKLLQTRPQEFRLDGQERLKITKSMPDKETRIALLDQFLMHLTM
jgi:transcription-repair coupling factor (superfamily II helicase)